MQGRKDMSLYNFEAPTTIKIPVRWSPKGFPEFPPIQVSWGLVEAMQSSTCVCPSLSVSGNLVRWELMEANPPCTVCPSLTIPVICLIKHRASKTAVGI